METYIKDLIDLPEQVNRGDFVLRLTEGVAHPDATVRDYVVTPQLEKCFDTALALIKSAVEGRTSNMIVLTPTLHALVHLDPGMICNALGSQLQWAIPNNYFNGW